MANLSKQVFGSVLDILRDLFGLPNMSSAEEALVELIITIEDSNINIREFAAYLAFIDRVYGKLSPKGLRSYSHQEWGQLEISEIREGSLELVISKIASEYKNVAALFVLWQILKQLPNVTAAYKNFYEGVLARRNAKRIKEEMKREAYLQQLDKKRFNQLASLVNSLISSEKKNLSAPTRFARNSVKTVVIVVRDKNQP